MNYETYHAKILGYYCQKVIFVRKKLYFCKKYFDSIHHITEKLRFIHVFHKTVALVALLLASLSLYAGNGKGNLIRQLGNLIDTLTVRGIDKQYIHVPEKPWQVMLKGNANEMNLDVESFYRGEGLDYRWDSKLETGTSKSFGAWVGYRGYGLGYQFTIGSVEGANFNFGVGGSTYTIRLNVRRFKTSETDIRFRGAITDEETPDFDDKVKMEMDEPIFVKSTLLEGYYMFNGKHFSNTAGYDQSTIQLRSAGSVIVGTSWFTADIDYAANINTLFVMMMNNIGRIKVNQLNIGAGYAYNWVPAKGWLVNAMFMPSLAAINRLKMWNYDINPNLDKDEPLLVPKDVTVSHSRLKVNLAGWLTLVYNHKDWFATLKGQWNQFTYKRNDSNGQLSNWYVNVGIGKRF